MQEVWTKALARRETDPEGAVTSARTLLESLCKHILDDAKEEYRQGAPLPELYKATAAVLEISPNEETAPIFTALFTACSEVIASVGKLRNHLSDAHGRGPFGTMPDWRHAELAVTLSGAMATYLAAVWKGRQPTVADVLRRILENPPKPMGPSQRYSFEALARSPIGEKIASKLQVSDIVAHCEARRDKVTPQTLMQDVTWLRVALGDGLEEVFDDAVIALRSLKLIAKSESRQRRAAHEEYDALIRYFRDLEKKPRTTIRMSDVLEFAVWSGRTISQVCKLRWSDVDFDKHTCTLPGSRDAFPLLENAWEIVEARSKGEDVDLTGRIFPYNAKSASASHTIAKKTLSKTMPSIADLRLNDLRFEAVNRLLERGHAPHIVARATGMHINKVDEIFKDIEKAA